MNNLFYFVQEFLNAVVYGDKEIFQLCLEKGANINYQGRVSYVKIEELILISFPYWFVKEYQLVVAIP